MTASQSINFNDLRFQVELRVVRIVCMGTALELIWTADTIDAGEHPKSASSTESFPSRTSWPRPPSSPADWPPGQPLQRDERLVTS